MQAHRRAPLRSVLPLRHASVLATLAGLLLGGCASAPPGQSGEGSAPAMASGQCQAPPPNLRAAYNRSYTVLGKRYTPLRSADGYAVEGTASWYGWESGATTSMGTRFNPRALTAASRVLPLPSCVEVTNLRNGRSAFVLVNDRGPFVDSRVMDLSYGAAKALGISGTSQVRIVAFADGVAPPLPAANAPAPAAAPTPAPAAPPESAAPPAILAQTLPPQASSPQAADSAPDPDPIAALLGSASAAPAPQPAPRVADAAVVAQAPQPRSYVQAGAYTIEANAREQASRLREAGIAPVDVIPGTIRGRTYYKVQIGPLAQPDPALRQRLAALGVHDYEVVSP